MKILQIDVRMPLLYFLPCLSRHRCTNGRKFAKSKKKKEKPPRFVFDTGPNRPEIIISFSFPRASLFFCNHFFFFFFSTFYSPSFHYFVPDRRISAPNRKVAFYIENVAVLVRTSLVDRIFLRHETSFSIWKLLLDSKEREQERGRRKKKESVECVNFFDRIMRYSPIRVFVAPFSILCCCTSPIISMGTRRRLCYDVVVVSD